MTAERNTLTEIAAFVSPSQRAFFNTQGEPILGTCEHVPHKVIINDKTNCKQWRPTEG